MPHKFLDSLRRHDAELGDTIRNRHREWFEAIETALDQVIRGLNEFAEQKRKPKDELESARLFLATGTFRSLHTALSLVERGYYQQSAGLVRTAMEEMLIAEDVEIYPKTLEVLMHGNPDNKVRLGRDDLSYGAMVARISPKAAEAWKKTYDAVSVYATHPRSAGLELLVTWDSQSKSHLGLRPRYDREQLAVCVELIAGECLHLIKTVMQALHGIERDWVLETHPAFANLESLIDEVRQEVKTS